MIHINQKIKAVKIVSSPNNTIDSDSENDMDELMSSDNDDRIIVTDVKLPSDAPARMKVLRVDGIKWYLTLVYHENKKNKPFALFCHTNHPEKTAHTSDAVSILMTYARNCGILDVHVDKLESSIRNENNVGKLTRTISLLLRHNVPIHSIVGQLEKVQNMPIGSFLFQIKKFLSQYIKEGQKAEGIVCDACGSHNVVFSEGCYQCKDCFSSKCG
jgi:hypothetical protein